MPLYSPWVSFGIPPSRFTNGRQQYFRVLCPLIAPFLDLWLLGPGALILIKVHLVNLVSDPDYSPNIQMVLLLSRLHIFLFEIHISTSERLINSCSC